MSFIPNMAGINYIPGPAPTAQTSGFAQAEDAPPSQQVGTSTSGGLGSSPLAPKPGTSINPATGQLHSEGLTRDELNAKKAAEAAAVTAQLSSSTSAELNDQVHLTGGLGSSPLVPKPGTSINPSTGQLHSEGLTREELQAKKAAEAAAITSQVSPATSAKPGDLSPDELKHIQEKGKELLDPTPLAQQARRSSSPKKPTSALPPVSESEPHATALTTDGRRLSELPGREQAARQLVGNTLAAAPVNSRTDSGLSTPGQELPGGWGPTRTVPLPGTAPNAPTSIYEDVAEGLEKAGRAAFAVIPSPIKDALSGSPTSPKASTSPKAPSSPLLGVSPPQGRRSSVTALFDQAKVQASKLVEEAQGTLQNTQRRASASLSRDSEFRNKLENFVDNFAHPGFVAAGTGRPGVVGLVPRYSLPSEEPAGALPGEHTTGVGALPGSSNETGVAVLPDEKKVAQSSQENQSVLPGENSGGISVLTLPDQTATQAYRDLDPAASSLAGPSGTTSTAEPSITNPSSTTPASQSVPSASASGSGYSGLAPALPATALGFGGDKGATDVPKALGTSSSNTNSLTTAPEPTSTVESGSTPATSTLSPATATSATTDPTSAPGTAPGTANGSIISSTESATGSSPLAVPETRHGNERTSSSASVTAIRHGHEGSVSKSSPLAAEGNTVPEHSELDTSSIGQQSTTPGTGPSHTTSLTPGNEHEGIGHPSTRGVEGASREPGTYPSVDHSKSTSGGTGTAVASESQLGEEKTKAENLAEAPAQTSDLTKTSTPSTTKKDEAISKANGPEKSSSPAGTTAASGDRASDLPHPTSANDAKDIAGINHNSMTSPATSTAKPTATGSTPSTKTDSPVTPSSKTSAGNGNGNGSGHNRKGSTSSEKKRGLFGKIKDKLKH
ncbi:uncharacterized protein I303_107010 [Kwoniella dejecticola CBS 10117]|uniref:Uncharacterized protein n=1 Tax=Kwoniella dejecticola CBS 10117 TaxID=1296121 RepID=A0A1A5ZYH0_9TREE|nr:uncharacterized protein I303_06411 [Kwoniella dejecticola CBS 10117]OBR82854.1 hypothetical protein I303_06411 [Kwoniella dejecticola CBS 10117]